MAASDTEGSPDFKPLRGPSDDNNNNQSNAYLTDGGYESSVVFQSDVEGSSIRPGPDRSGGGYLSAGGGSSRGGFRPKGSVVIQTPKGSQRALHLRKNSLEGSGTESATDYVSETDIEFNDEGNITQAEPADIPPLAPVTGSSTTTTTGGGGAEALVSPRRQESGSAPATARGPIRDPSAPQNNRLSGTTELSDISEDDAASRPSQMGEEVGRRRNDDEDEEGETAAPAVSRQQQQQQTARHRTGTDNSEATQGSVSQRPATSTDDGSQYYHHIHHHGGRPNQLSGTYPPSITNEDDGRASTVDGSQAQPEPLETTGLSPQRVLTEEEKAELELRIRDEKIKALKEAKKRQRLEEEERRKIPKNWNQKASKNWNDAFRHGGGLSAEDLIARNAKIAASQGRSGSVNSMMYAAQVNGSAAGSLMGGAAPSERSVGTRQRQKAYDNQLREKNRSTKEWMNRVERGGEAGDPAVGQSYMLSQPRVGSRHADPHQQQRSSQYYMHPGNQQGSGQEEDYYYQQQQQEQEGDETLQAHAEDQEVRQISEQHQRQQERKKRNPSQKEELEEYLDQQQEQHGKKVKQQQQQLTRNQSRSQKSKATDRSATANTVQSTADFESCISVSLDGSAQRDRHGEGSEFDNEEELDPEENPLNYGEEDDDEENPHGGRRKKSKAQRFDENGNPIDDDDEDEEQEEFEDCHDGDEGDDDASPQRGQPPQDGDYEGEYEEEDGGPAEQEEGDHYYGGEGIPDDFREGALEADQQVPTGCDRLYLDFERRYQERKNRERKEQLKEERRRLARDRISQVHERLYREGMDQIHRQEFAVEENKRMKEMEEEYLMQHHLAAGAILHSADGHSIVDDVEFYDKMEIVRYDPQLEPEKAEAIGHRLYKRHTGGDSKAAEEERQRREFKLKKECTFHPNINSDRAPITGDQDVGDRLYKEGRKTERIRNKKRQESDLKMRQEIVAEMEKNNHHLKERFKKDPELRERMLKDAIKSSGSISKKEQREKERNTTHRRAY